MSDLQVSIFTVIELISVVTGIASVYLAARNRVDSWIVGIVNCICFLILFLNARLYGSAGIQVFYIAMSVWGWYHWKYGGEDKTEAVIRRMSGTRLLYSVIATALATFILHEIFWRTDNPAPFLDAITTAMSLLATALLASRIVENWFVWIAADVIFIILYFSQGLYLVSLLYVAFACLCIVGLRDWKRDLAQREVAL